MNKQGIKIASINGAEVLKLKEGRDAEIKYTGVFANSMLLDKLKDLGLNISKQGSTRDIIGVEFDYSYTSLEAEELVKKYKQLKKDNKKSVSTVNKIEKEIESKINRTDELENELIELENELEEIGEYESDEFEIDKKFIKAITNKIDTRLFKIYDLKSDIKSLKYEFAINDFCNNIEENIIKQEELNLGENIMKRDALRDLLYEEGFSLDTYKTVKKEKVFDKTIEYRFWFRSPSKSKGGECLFINVELFDAINKWQTMDIELKEDKDGNVMLVEMEAYKSLVSSFIEGYIDIKPSEILVVSDLNSYSELEDVINIVRDEKTGFSKAEHIKAKNKNVLFDGMALIQGGVGFKVLRNHFFKTCAFCSDFQQFFKDYYKDEYETATIIDRYGREVKVSEIKLITTENSMKMEKFLGNTKEAFENWASHVEADGNRFGIAKVDHKSKYGENQRMSYQMCQTLDISKEDISKLFANTKDYIDKLKNDDELFIKHLRNTKSSVNNNELLADLATTYPNFVNSYLFKDARKREIYEYAETLKKSKLLTTGDNETVCANCFTLLLYCVGELDAYIKIDEKGGYKIEGYTDETLPEANSCYCKRFDDKTEIGAFRNPHNTFHNILYFVNNYSDKMDKYFNFGDNVIAVNLIGNGWQNRASGFDEDSDFFLCSSTKIVVDACKKAQKYPTIINSFKKSPKKYKNTMKDLSEIDNGLALSQKAIGTSSNVAMLYLSQYWDRVNKLKEIDIINSLGDIDFEYIDYLKKNNDKLLDNVCILATLAQVAVDCSKRSFTVGTGANGLINEIERLRKELPLKAKPTFWQYTSSIVKRKTVEKQLKNDDKELWKSLKDKEKKIRIDNKINEIKDSLVDFDCPSNWILKEVDKIGKANYTDRITDSSFLVKFEDETSKARKQATKVEVIVSDFNDITNFINTNDDMEDEGNCLYYNVLYKEYMDKMFGLNITQEAISLLIIRALDVENKYLKSNKKIKTKLLNMLYKYNRDKFMKCFKECSEDCFKKNLKK